jgi:transcription termination/antitermination protein NusG
MASQTIVSQSHPFVYANQEPWYAIRTKSRHEKIVSNQLETDGFDSYLPTVQQFRQWSDRRKLIDFPLFPGYVFVRIPQFLSQKTEILRKVGVIGFVGNGRGAALIPDVELSGVRLLLRNRIPYASHPYLEVGQRIRVTDGVLRGVEGILVGLGNKNGLVVSVDAIQKSLIIQLQGYRVQVI